MKNDTSLMKGDRLAVIAPVSQVLPLWQEQCVEGLGGRVVAWVDVPAPVSPSGLTSLLQRYVTSSMDRPAKDVGRRPNVVVGIETGRLKEKIEALEVNALLDLPGGHGWLSDETGVPVWYFEFGLDGSIPGVRELAGGASVLEARLISLYPGAQRKCLRKGVFPLVRDGIRRSRGKLLRTVALWPSAIGSATEATAAAAKRPATSVSVPGALRVVQVEAQRWIRRVIQLLTVTQWNIGIVHEPVALLLNPGYVPHVNWFKGGGSILADPFGLYSDGRLYVIVEEKSLEGGAAWISVLEGEQPFERATTSPILKASHHLSYPSLLEFDGERYMIPEASRSGQVVLYKAQEFPWKWEKTAVLIEQPLLDPTVFRYQDRWWMLGSMSDFELHAWYADSLAGPWTVHRANPLKVDVRSSRPAGRPFMHEGLLYRPAQDMSRTYGGAIALNRIERLDDAAFEETTIRIVEPDSKWPYDDGTHHLCPVNGSYLIDAKRLSIRPRLLARRVFRRLRGERSPLTGSEE